MAGYLVITIVTQGRKHSKGKEKGLIGDDLRSQRVAPQVPSALAGLTTGFGMGPGVPPPLQSPTRPFELSIVNCQLLMVNLSFTIDNSQFYSDTPLFHGIKSSCAN